MDLTLKVITPAKANEKPPGTVLLAKFDSVVEGDDRPNHLLVVRKNNNYWYVVDEESKRGTLYLDSDAGLGLAPERVFKDRRQTNLQLFEVYTP